MNTEFLITCYDADAAAAALFASLCPFLVFLGKKISILCCVIICLNHPSIWVVVCVKYEYFRDENHFGQFHLFSIPVGA